MHNLEVFAVKVCNKKILKGSNPSELLRDIYFENLTKKDIKNESKNVKNRKKNSVFEKISPTYGAFHQHVKHSYLQPLIFNPLNASLPSHRNLQLIFCANQLSGFCMSVAQGFNGLIKQKTFGLITNLDTDECRRI